MNTREAQTDVLYCSTAHRLWPKRGHTMDPITRKTSLKKKEGEETKGTAERQKLLKWHRSERPTMAEWTTKQ